MQLAGGMNERTKQRSTTLRIHPALVAGPLVITAALMAILGYQLRDSAPEVTIEPATLVEVPGDLRRSPSVADGVLPDDTSVFDDRFPGIANLDPALLAALRQAARDAAVEGVEFVVNSGWRSPEYQAELLRKAILEHGSEQEAARWVASPNTSAHVSGDAVDIGTPEAALWLSEQGARYGLCQIYSNEPWHFELRPEAIHQGCPSMYADPTHDPRMQVPPPPQDRSELRSGETGA